jgi:hypothetical protein
MEAPQGRYRVIEKDGRLVVIDNRTGNPHSSPIAPPLAALRGRSAVSPPGPVALPGPGRLDRAAGFLLAAAAKEWDSEGRAVIAWEWGQAGESRRWDAALAEADQRLMGRALLALLAAPVLLLLLIFAEGDFRFVGSALALAPTAWGARTLLSLYLRTDDPGLRDESIER